MMPMKKLLTAWLNRIAPYRPADLSRLDRWDGIDDENAPA
jgi:hypothetical protein